METTTAHRIFPGLIDENLEFFKTSNGIKAFTNGKVFSFNELPMAIYQLLKEKMKSSEGYKILKKWHPESELQQIEKFVECRFGGLDFKPDIAGKILQQGEYWECPLRGNCPGEGKVCNKLSYNGHELEAIEIKLLKMIATTSLTNEVLSIELNVPLGSLHKLKKDLYQKLQVQTKQEATLIAATELNLV